MRRERTKAAYQGRHVHIMRRGRPRLRSLDCIGRETKKAEVEDEDWRTYIYVLILLIYFT